MEKEIPPYLYGNVDSLPATSTKHVLRILSLVFIGGVNNVGIGINVLKLNAGQRNVGLGMGALEKRCRFI